MTTALLTDDELRRRIEAHAIRKKTFDQMHSELEAEMVQRGLQVAA